MISNFELMLLQAFECSRNTLQPHLQPIYVKAYGVIFLGTPHQGSGKADIGILD